MWSPLNALAAEYRYHREMVQKIKEFKDVKESRDIQRGLQNAKAYPTLQNEMFLALLGVEVNIPFNLDGSIVKIVSLGFETKTNDNVIQLISDIETGETLQLQYVDGEIYGNGHIGQCVNAMITKVR